ncbi:MAG: hypothetical protein CMI61_04645 [Parvibaculum sp.]|nr:hypothetical protein [Parvibaculum sp.]
MSAVYHVLDGLLRQPQDRFQGVAAPCGKMRAIVTHNAIANYSQSWHIFILPSGMAGNRRKPGQETGIR